LDKNSLILKNLVKNELANPCFNTDI